MTSAYQRFGAFYARSFAQRPWATLAVANGTLGVVADSLAQTLEKAEADPRNPNQDTPTKETATQQQGWDWQRSGRFLAFGIGMAPILAEWNKFIEYRFPLRPAGTAASSAAANAGRVSLLALGKRVAFDQILFAPFGLVCFVGAMGAMEFGSVEGVRTKFEDMYKPALLANWQVWPAIQLINFRFVPLRFRVPFTSACGIAWTLYLSLLAAAKGTGEREKKLGSKDTKASA